MKSNSLVCVALGVLYAICAPALAADEPERYTLVDQQGAFSVITRNTLFSKSVIPFDKTCSELSVVQQRLLRSAYVDMDDKDEPPFPAEGLRPLYLTIYRISELFDFPSGKLLLYVTVDSHGVGQSIEVVSTPNAQFSNAVANLLVLTRSKPAVCGGQPCTMQYPLCIVYH